MEFENEVFTTKQAGRKMEKARSILASFRKRQRLSFDEKMHSSAAALILQSYFDRSRSA